MRNLIIVAVIVAIAIVAPELRNTIVIGAFCLFAGLLLGSRYGGKHYAELMDARSERMATPVQRHGIGKVTQ